MWLLSGIARPAAFATTVASSGATVAGHTRCRDHHRFRPRELRAVARHAERAGARWIVTTEKDATRIDDAGQLPLFVLRGDVEIVAGADRLDQALRERCGL